MRVDEVVYVGHDVVEVLSVLDKISLARQLEYATLDPANEAKPGLRRFLFVNLVPNLGESVDHDSEQEVKPDEVDEDEKNERKDLQ